MGPGDTRMHCPLNRLDWIIEFRHKPSTGASKAIQRFEVKTNGMEWKYGSLGQALALGSLGIIQHREHKLMEI